MKNLILAISTVFILLGCNNDDGPTVDMIAQNLTASLSSYENASANEWVEISESEYNVLASQLSNVSISGCSDAVYNQFAGSSQVHETIVNKTILTIPANNYLFAFKYRRFGGSSSETSPPRVKWSSHNASGFIDVGNGLPLIPNNENYFALKLSSNQATEDMYLGFYGNKGISTTNTGESYHGDGDVNSVTALWNSTAQYQGLSTPQKQW